MVVIHLYRCSGITVEVQSILKKHIHSGEQNPDDAIVLTVPELSVLIELSW
jgi:hypothetical protein